MKKEHVFIGLVGLFLLTYLLDALVDPFQLSLPTPYHYLHLSIFLQYPFTMVSVALKAIGLMVAPLWLLSFISKQYTGKSLTLFVLAVLMQLYALQQIATNSQILPIEWNLSLAYAGALLVIPIVILFLMGMATSMHEKVVGKVHKPAATTAPKAPTPPIGTPMQPDSISK